MKKRALIVAISDYSPLLPVLHASVYEGRQWHRLLADVYGFAHADIFELYDHLATKRTIADRLMWLLTDSRPEDQLVFIFCGHGVRRPSSFGDRVDLQDEGFVAYPAGALDPIDVAIFDDDLTHIYCDMGVAPSARPTFILDCCYSGGFDFDEAEKGRIAFAPEVMRWNRESENYIRFGQQLSRGGVCTNPLIIAASREYDIALEVPRGDRARTLFSSLAIERLVKNPVLTYEDLLSEIKPSMRYARQEPSLGGDPDRKTQRFFM